jgi:hypothetical protein
MKRVVRQDDGSRTSSAKSPPENRRFLRPPFVTLVVLGGVGAFVAYMLWPTWPNAPIAVDAPAIPITVAGVLFNVPPAAIRAKVLRHAGTHERIDLAFLWPSLTPPPADTRADKPAAKAEQDAAAPPANASDRLFVTIAALGAVLAPAERLRSIYPRYVEAQATAGPDGLAFLPFRAGTPYQGEGSPSSSSPAVPGRTVRCAAPASMSVRSMPQRSRCAFRASGWRTGAALPPASTGSWRNCIRRVRTDDGRWMTDDNNRQQRSDVRTPRARWAYPSSAPSVVGRLTRGLRHPSRSLPRIAIWKLYDRSSSSSSTNSTPMNSSPT